MSRKKIARIVFIIVIFIAIVDVFWLGTNYENFTSERDYIKNIRAIDENTPYLEKTQDLNVSTQDINELSLINPYGSVDIQGTSGDKVEVEAEIIVYGETEEDIEGLIDQINIEKKVAGDELTLGLEYEKIPEKVWGVKIQCTVKAPERLALTVQSGKNLRVENFVGPVKLNHSGLGFAMVGSSEERYRKYFEKSYVRNIEKDLELSNIHASLEVENIGGDVDATVNHGMLDIEKVKGNLTLTSQHSDIELNSIDGNVVTYNSFDDIIVSQVKGDLSSKLEHTPLEANVDGKLKIQGQFSDVKVRDIDNDLEANLEHGDIRIYSELNHKLEVSAKHGSIKADDLGLKVEKDDNNMLELMGTVGEGEYNLEVEMEFGNVIFK